MHRTAPRIRDDRSAARGIGQRIAAAGVAFFLLKGLLWLIIPGLIYLSR